MAEGVNRIVLKKIYLGNAALFGLLYGVVIGLIMALVSVLSPGLSSAFSGLISGGSFVIALVVFFVYLVVSVIGMIISALIYNLIAVLGGSLHFGLIEHSGKNPENKVEKNLDKKGGKKVSSDSPTRPEVISGGSTMRLNSISSTKQNTRTNSMPAKNAGKSKQNVQQGQRVAQNTRAKSNPNTAVVGRKRK